MIFVSVGTQLPFERLVRMVDEYAEMRPSEVFYAQIGGSQYEPQNVEFSRALSFNEYENMVKNCNVIVAHAGIGSVLTAFKYGKPLVAIPRMASLGEHRNDHQLATAKQIQRYEGVYIANSTEELASVLDGPLLSPSNEEIERSRDIFRNNFKELVGRCL